MLQHLEKKLHLIKLYLTCLDRSLIQPMLKLQLIGVFDINTMQLIADSLMELGTSKALVLNSRDGMDEASIYAETDIVEIKDNVKTLSIQ